MRIGFSNSGNHFNKLWEASCQLRKARIFSLAFALRKFRNLRSTFGANIANLNFKKKAAKTFCSEAFQLQNKIPDESFWSKFPISIHIGFEIRRTILNNPAQQCPTQHSSSKLCAVNFEPFQLQNKIPDKSFCRGFLFSISHQNVFVKFRFKRSTQQLSTKCWHNHG